MILLDTNVISELMRPAPAGVVLAWSRVVPPTELATTTITVAELGAGLSVLPDGARRRDLQARSVSLLNQGFGQRIFAFDAAAASVYGELFARRQRAGRPVIGFDLLIAAIALSQGFSIATRNVEDFDGCDVVVVDPWAEAALQ